MTGPFEQPALHDPADAFAYPPPGTVVVAYVSDHPAPPSSIGTPPIDEQEAIIRSECRIRGWRLLEVISDRSDGGSGRTRLDSALERLRAMEASAIVVTQLDRIGASALELGSVFTRVADAGAALVSLEYGLSTGSLAGTLLADVVSDVAAWEAGQPEGASGGLSDPSVARLARAVWDEASLRARIGDMRRAGMTLQAIADALNAEGIPTLRGGRTWRVSSVQSAAGYRRPRRTRGAASPAS